MQQQFFATCPKGLESLLEDEIKLLAGEDTRQTAAGVYFHSDLAVAYRICLWSRLANKVLLPLTRFEVNSADDLYAGVRSIPWEDHINPRSSFLVDFIGTNSVIRNSQFGAVTVKDGVVDRVREVTGQRPSITKQAPDLRLNARLIAGSASAGQQRRSRQRSSGSASTATLVLSLDLSGDSLHRRGYRQQQGAAPLKENLAAALLLRAGWPQLAQQGGALLDPMCGSGTLLIEAAFMAADIAPGILRPRFGFEQWLGHRNDSWLELREEALDRRAAGLAQPLVEIRGYDSDVRVIRTAEANIEQAKLDHWLRVSCKELMEFKRPTHKALSTGLVICNPPYGERLGETEALQHLYGYLGQRLKQEFNGWRAAVFTGNPELGQRLGLRAEKKYKFYNGTLPSQLLTFQIAPENYYRNEPATKKDIEKKPEKNLAKNAEEGVDKTSAQTSASAPASAPVLTEGAQMVANRLKKNQKQLAKWIQQQTIHSYRVYDADMPEYAAAIDVYHCRNPQGNYQADSYNTENSNADSLNAGLQSSESVYAHVQEYAAPKSVDPAKAAKRFADIQAAVPTALGVDANCISYKQRRRNSGKTQYEKLDNRGEQQELQVQEGAAKFLINLWDYLDTGLFLDHRPLRTMISAQAKDKRFLNLFCYTATASVHAALGGAKYTVSVDMSNTYLSWAKRNFALNGLGEHKNRFVQADCQQWLQDCDQTFDLILLDPPSFSNSKRMQGVLDIQQDHSALIDNTMRLLSPTGTLFFSTNLRGFKLDAALSARFNVEDISQQTIDRDFQRNSKIHRCWRFQH